MQKSVDEITTLQKLKIALEEMANCAETLSISVILLGFARVLLKPKISKMKRGRRKKEVDTAADSSSGNDTSIKYLESLMKYFEETASEFESLGDQIIEISKGVDLLSLTTFSELSFTHSTSTFLMITEVMEVNVLNSSETK